MDQCRGVTRDPWTTGTARIADLSPLQRRSVAHVGERDGGDPQRAKGARGDHSTAAEVAGCQRWPEPPRRATDRGMTMEFGPIRGTARSIRSRASYAPWWDATGQKYRAARFCTPSEGRGGGLGT